MKKITSLLLVLYCYLFCGVVRGYCYSFIQLKDDFVKDTKEIFLKDLNTNANWDFLEKEYSKRLKFSLSSGLVAWKFIAIEVIGLYTPNSADSIVEGGFSFPIRIGEIPMGRGTKLSDYVDKKQKDDRSENLTLIDRVKLGTYLAKNLSTGSLGFGVSLGLIW